MSENLTIKLEHVNVNDWDEPKDIKGEVYFFESTFYGKYYSFQVYRRHLDNDSNCVLCEGDSDLFDSFESAIEDDYWEQIVLICKKYIELEINQTELDFKE